VSLILDGVQSPFNVGAITRTAAAWRVEHLYLCGQTPLPSAAKAAKVALGTQRYVTWSVTERGADAVRAARADGYSVVGLELVEGAEPLHLAAQHGDVCLVVGNEDHGVPISTLEACDAVAYLPLTGRVGSLNVATAVAVGVYELRRRDWT
jgi:tRNA (guanosine-2'-O-)-methyltransferase